MRFCVLAMLLAAAPALAQPTPGTPPPPDHGMVLSTCMEVAPGKLKDTTVRSDTKNYVYRGRVITLDKEKSVHLCFDTDLMRVAGAWVGKPVAYAADKNMGPAVEGKMIFSTKPGPGWANKDSKWGAPREEEGPLPKEWAHYRGLYLVGDNVVLKYSVGDCSVMETFGCVKENGLVAITRTMRLGPSDNWQEFLVCHEPRAKTCTFKKGERDDQPPLYELDRGEESMFVAMKTSRLESDAVGVSYRFVDDAKDLLLAVPPHKNAFEIRLTHAVLPKGKSLWPVPKAVQGAPQMALNGIINGGPPRWTKTIETKATLVPAGRFPYVVDDIGLPTDNPWHASIRFGGLDFFSDGRAALCTWDGDVWIADIRAGSVSDGKIGWKRFAAGLHQPLGLKIVNDFIYVAGRDQITKLHDLNGDGEADFYENFNNDAALTLQRHEFVMDLQTDAKGNFYFGRSGHYVGSKKGDNCCIYKLSPDGEKLEKFATGFREPNGLSIGPDGTIIAGDNEGNGIPQTPLYRLEAGGFYGYRPSKSELEATKGATWGYSKKPIVWLPVSFDRSAGSQVWATDDRFGPLKGQLLHTSYGHAALYGVLIDKQAEPWQGAVWKLPLAFNSGVMRARVNPKDGQVYLCGLRGWSTNAVKDGQFCRVRYVGPGEPSGVSRRVPLPVGFEVGKGGLKLTFSDPLDRKTAEDEDNWTGDWVDAVGKTGAIKKAKEDLPITSVRLSDDRKSVTVSIDKLRPVSNFTLRYQVKGADATPASGELHGTIHRAP